jgi:hypothetical protein
MPGTNDELQEGLKARYPQFSSESDARLNLFLNDARAAVPLCQLPEAKQDLALIYKAASLLVGAGSTSVSGTVKREKAGDVEREYVDGSKQVSTNNFEQLYQNWVRAYIRNSPMVTGWNG